MKTNCEPKSLRYGLVLALGCVLTIVGCSSESDKASLFDHDHTLPSHWPLNLSDTAAKIRQRLDQLDGDSGLAAPELVDLVSWTPEFAADTSMPEAEWQSIYEMSESLRLQLENSKGDWDRESRERALELCKLIDKAWDQLPNEERQAERYQGHRHGHGHGHGHDHGHGDHGHSHDHGDGHSHNDHDHGDGRSHDHDHGAHDHGHGHDEDGHSHDHDHGAHDHDHGHDGHGHSHDGGDEHTHDHEEGHDHGDTGSSTESTSERGGS
ncbi:MAG: hypothetical protein AAGG48_12810 [Planctomycetota bacterium]